MKHYQAAIILYSLIIILLFVLPEKVGLEPIEFLVGFIILIILNIAGVSHGIAAMDKKERSKETNLFFWI